MKDDRTISLGVKPQPEVKQKPPWWVPVRNGLIMGLVFTLIGCCLGYFLFPFLPKPVCIGGYGADYSGEVLAIATLFGIGFILTLPVIAFMSLLMGFFIHFIFNSSGRERFAERISIALGAIVALGFWLVITILLNQYICEL